MSYYNYQNFNMMNTGWGGLLQQGLGMLGGNSYGMMGMGGSIFGGNNFFTNCFGEPNYDAMAGFGVANALTGVLGQAVSQIRTEKAEAKQVEIDTEARLEEVNAEIKELENTDYEKAIDSKYDKNIETAKTNLTNATTALNDANKSKTALEAELASETDATKKADIQKKIDALKIDEKKAAFDKLNDDENTKGSVKYYEKQKADEIKAKKAEIDQSIKQLNTEKAKLEEQVTNTKLAKAQGKKYQATKQKDFNAKWDNGKPKAGTEFTSGDMRFVIGQLSKAASDDDKKAWAEKIDTIYKYFLNNDTRSITSEFKFAAQTAQKYLG